LTPSLRQVLPCHVPGQFLAIITPPKVFLSFYSATNSSRCQQNMTLWIPLSSLAKSVGGLEIPVDPAAAREEVLNLVRNRQRIVVVCGPYGVPYALKYICTDNVLLGAGVSVSAGIPDFRSPTGVFVEMQGELKGTGIKTGSSMFDMNLMTSSAVHREALCRMVGKLAGNAIKAQPAVCHHLWRRLDKDNRLVRVYTQNVDGLEKKAGMSYAECGHTETQPDTRGKQQKDRFPRCIPLHGVIEALQCAQGHFHGAMDHLDTLSSGHFPQCPTCLQVSDNRAAQGRRRPTVQPLQSSMVLYGQEHPNGEWISNVMSQDCKHGVDLLLVMGTSLTVQGAVKLVKTLSKATHNRNPPGQAIYINLGQPAPQWKDIFDIWVEEDIDSFASAVIASMEGYSGPVGEPEAPAHEQYARTSGSDSVSLCDT
jgi:NAD-dependent SIR2 family protein deacetylase